MYGVFVLITTYHDLRSAEIALESPDYGLPANRDMAILNIVSSIYFVVMTTRAIHDQIQGIRRVGRKISHSLLQTRSDPDIQHGGARG